MAEPSRPIVRFSTFELDLQSGELRKAGVRVALQEQSRRVLVRLLEQPGDLVTREELRQQLWPADTFVDFEHGLNTAIKRLRDALGDAAESPRFIETLPRRGHRFIAPTDLPGPTLPMVAAQPKAIALRRRARWMAALVMTRDLDRFLGRQQDQEGPRRRWARGHGM